MTNVLDIVTLCVPLMTLMFIFTKFLQVCMTERPKKTVTVDYWGVYEGAQVKQPVGVIQVPKPANVLQNNAGNAR